ncbi:MAG: hypothetical protein GEU83_16835 [Pseudonocardiaceae bacterium]|nr:hypothetical protein [Pseudonocardiaceae bacterium]
MEQLASVAERLPDGTDTELRVGLCDGGGLDVSRELEIDHFATVQPDGAVAEWFVMAKGHPHLDRDSGRSTSCPALPTGSTSSCAAGPTSREIRPGLTWAAAAVNPASQRLTRETLVRLFEAGEIPFDKPARHRRILPRDVLAYRSAPGGRARRASMGWCGCPRTPGSTTIPRMLRSTA